ncbi:dishevelled associated activator of morphogenesis 2-like protein, partial [Reticulomyxa filosa]
MDGCPPALISEFQGEKPGAKEGGEDNDGENGGGDAPAPTVNINDPKFEKYHKMKKIGMPLVSILNKMRYFVCLYKNMYLEMDGFSSNEIDAFEGKTPVAKSSTKSGEKKDKKQLYLEKCEKLGIPARPYVEPKLPEKLKKIHWTVVPLESVKKTIWEDLAKTGETVILSQAFELHFQIRQKKPRMVTRNRGESAIGQAQKPKQVKQQQYIHIYIYLFKITFIPMKKDQSIQIGLRKLGLSNEEIYNAIYYMQEQVLDEEKLGTIFDLLPNAEEVTLTEGKADEAGNDCEFFGPSELFWLEMSAIPEVRKQVEAWLFTKTFAELCKDRLYQVNLLKRACEAIRNSQGLRCYLNLILTMGNL